MPFLRAFLHLTFKPNILEEDMKQKDLIQQWADAIQSSKSTQELTQDFYALIKVMENELVKGGAINLPKIGALKAVHHLSEAEEQIYKLIYRTYLVQFMPNMQYDEIISELLQIIQAYNLQVLIFQYKGTEITGLVSLYFF